VGWGSTYARVVFDQAAFLEVFLGRGEGVGGDAEVLPYGTVVPEEVRFLEAAVEASEVDVEEHGDAGYVAGVAEVEKSVFEELVAFHGDVLGSGTRRLRRLGRNDRSVASRGRNDKGWRFHHIFTTLAPHFGGFGAVDD